ncbi:Zn 2cys6 transcription factor protein [Pleurostoma richardsiae]|uniref:Zn 2cys6 transcription factor protein n=1 Tax=Pleurostoma richardsiae TaxID=41990 RepID=A0AA38VCZ3_9PEZI|nr:Zn 2cys6 transcription factor protein [Pleurostoma richardsiae]
MGRRPNPTILHFFERGEKLSDNSNRYHHRCKACGEDFPKGRIDSLTGHLMKRCPAISEADRINACLALNGMGSATQRNARPHVQPNGPPVDLALMQQRDWTALETLAEVSRQIDLSEKHDDRPQNANGGAPDGQGPPPAPHATERFELQEQFTLDNPPSAYTAIQPKDKQVHDQSSPADVPLPVPDRELSTEEKLQALALLQHSSPPSSLPESANFTVAAAATARLNPSLLDPQLLGDDEVARALGPALEAAAAAAATESSPAPPPPTSQPWGEITYSAAGLQAPIVANPIAPGPIAPGPIALNKGGFRMDTQNGAKARHSRARFDADRRKEVQEVRKIGACIRCRILRKNCSKGHPCETCRKVLSPRIWRSGCVRTKFTEQLDLYSAGVQIVLAQNRINSLRIALAVSNRGLTVEASLFPETGMFVNVEVFQSDGPKDPSLNPEASVPDTSFADKWPPNQVIMLDNDKEDVPAKLEMYMREMLHELVHREKSHFMRVTLETAIKLAQESNDQLLKKALELWGLVEILDRERQWTIMVKPTTPDAQPGWINAETDQETFTTICLQFTAAAERKAAATSKSLLTGMQRILQDSKTKIDFSMFFTTMILLNCVEKTTWSFKAWEQEGLQAMWPLEKEPANFTHQGYVIADLLRMLLAIRKALPRTRVREADGMLVTDEHDPIVKSYFEDLHLTVAEIQAKQQHPQFSPTDSRSYDLLFCSTLLLPGQD